MNKKLKKEIKKNKIEKVEKGEMVNKTTKKLDNDKSKPQPEKKLSRKSILLLVGGGILIVILIGAGVAISNTKQKEEKIIAVRLAAATRINQVWQEKQVDDKINGKNLGEVLGANWKTVLDGKKTLVEVNEEQLRIISLINDEKFNEHLQKWVSFFAEHSNITGENNQKIWRINFTISNAKVVYNNGWFDLTPEAGITNISGAGLNKTFSCNGKAFGYEHEWITVHGVEPLKHKKGEGLTYFFQQVAIIADEKTSLETLKTSYSDDNIKKIIEKFPLPSKTLITFRDQRISELEAKKPKESGETEEREPQPKKKEVVVKTYDVDGSDKDKTKSEEDITKTEYDNFLNEKGITDPNHRKIWTDKITLDDARITYNNGWTDLTPAAGIDNIDENNKTLDYCGSRGERKKIVNKISFLKYEKREYDCYFKWCFDILNAELDNLRGETFDNEKIESLPISVSRRSSLLKLKKVEIVKLEAMAWNSFFERHQINDETDQRYWKENYDTPEVAEAVYTNAISSLTLAPPLTETELEKINFSKNPTAIFLTTQNIPRDRFLAENENDIKNPENWTKGGHGLSFVGNPSEAQIAYNKGWKNNDYEILNKVIPLYGNEVRDFRGRVIFTDLEVLKVDRATLDVVGEILAEVRDPRRKNLTVFPKDIWLSDLGKLNDEFLPPKYKKEDIIKEIEAKEKNLLSGSYEKSQGKMSTIPTAAAVDSETTKTKDKSSIAETKETTTAAAPTKNIHDLIVSVPTNPGATVTSTSPKKDEKKERRGSKAEKIVENIKEGWNKSPINPGNWGFRKKSSDSQKSPEKSPTLEKVGETVMTEEPDEIETTTTITEEIIAPNIGEESSKMNPSDKSSSDSN